MPDMIDLPPEAYEHLSLLEFHHKAASEARRGVLREEKWLRDKIDEAHAGRLPDGRVIRVERSAYGNHLYLPDPIGTEPEKE